MDAPGRAGAALDPADIALPGFGRERHGVLAAANARRASTKSQSGPGRIPRGQFGACPALLHRNVREDRITSLAKRLSNALLTVIAVPPGAVAGIVPLLSQRKRSAPLE